VLREGEIGWGRGISRPCCCLAAVAAVVRMWCCWGRWPASGSTRGWDRACLRSTYVTPLGVTCSCSRVCPKSPVAFETGRSSKQTRVNCLKGVHATIGLHKPHQPPIYGMYIPEPVQRSVRVAGDAPGHVCQL
jgi:hypothetical protein